MMANIAKTSRNDANVTTLNDARISSAALRVFSFCSLRRKLLSINNQLLPLPSDEFQNKNRASQRESAINPKHPLPWVHAKPTLNRVPLLR